MAVMMEVEAQRGQEPETHLFVIDRDIPQTRYEVGIDQRADRSLGLRFGSILESIPDGGAVLGIGISDPGIEFIKMKYRNALTEHKITILRINSPHEFPTYPDSSIEAVIGNVHGGKEMPTTLTDINRITVPEGVIHLNVHKGPDQNGDFDNMFQLDDQLLEAGLHLKVNERNEREDWWTVEATTMPANMPPLRNELGEQPRAKVYGGKPERGEEFVIYAGKA